MAISRACCLCISPQAGVGLGVDGACGDMVPTAGGGGDGDDVNLVTFNRSLAASAKTGLDEAREEAIRASDSAAWAGLIGREG